MSKEEGKKGKKTERPAENVEEVEEPAVETPVIEEPKKCTHEELEAVSADVAELPSAVERRHDIFRCKSCGEIIVKDKK